MLRVQHAVERLGVLGGPLDDLPKLFHAETLVGPEVDAAGPGSDGADAVLRLPRIPDLADGKRVERQREDARDHGRDGDAAAREADDDRIARSTARAPRELAARIGPVAEERRHGGERRAADAATRCGGC